LRFTGHETENSAQPPRRQRSRPPSRPRLRQHSPQPQRLWARPPRRASLPRCPRLLRLRLASATTVLPSGSELERSTLGSMRGHQLCELGFLFSFVHIPFLSSYFHLIVFVEIVASDVTSCIGVSVCPHLRWRVRLFFFFFF
jgi:hypothetical protein